MKYKVVSLDYARKHAQPGWLILVRNNGLFSPLIRVATGGVYTHAAIVTNHDEVSEIKEFVGARITDFAFQQSQYTGRVDFYSISPEYHNLAGEYAACEVMRLMATKCKYDYRAIGRIAVRHIPIIRWFVRTDANDDGKFRWEDRRFCSEAVCAAYQFGLRDPVPNWPTHLTSPVDLSRSLMFIYEFTM